MIAYQCIAWFLISFVRPKIKTKTTDNPELYEIPIFCYVCVCNHRTRGEVQAMVFIWMRSDAAIFNRFYKKKGKFKSFRSISFCLAIGNKTGSAIQRKIPVRYEAHKIHCFHFSVFNSSILCWVCACVCVCIVCYGLVVVIFFSSHFVPFHIGFSILLPHFNQNIHAKRMMLNSHRDAGRMFFWLYTK